MCTDLSVQTQRINKMLTISTIERIAAFSTTKTLNHSKNPFGKGTQTFCVRKSLKILQFEFQITDLANTFAKRQNYEFRGE